MQDARKFVNERCRVQRGLITRDDMRAARVRWHQCATMVREGLLVPIGHHTFRHGVVELDDHGRLLAGCLDTGGVAALGSAAHLHGLSNFGPGAVPDVLVDGPKASYLTPLANVHTTTWLPVDDLVEVDGIPCTSVARTLFGLAAQVPRVLHDRVRGAVDDAIRLRLATDPWLWWRLEKLRCRGRNGVAMFESILTDRANGEITESWLEREFMAVLRAAGVQVPRCQRRIKAHGAFVARVDFIYDGTTVVVEVTGAVGHSTPAQRAADARRRNTLARAGFHVLEFTYEQVVAEPDRVVADVVGALEDRRDPGLSLPAS